MANRTRWLAVGAAVGGLGLVALVATPWLLKDEIAARALAEVDARLSVDPSVGGIDAGLLTSFPIIEVTLRDVVLAGEAPFEGVDLLRADEVIVGLDLWDVLTSDAPTLRRFALTRAVIDARVLEDGTANTTLTPSSEGDDAEGSADWEVVLADVTIIDAIVRYTDAQEDFSAQADDLDLVLSGRVGGRALSLETDLDIASLTVVSDGQQLLGGVRVDAVVPVAVDLDADIVTLSPSRIDLNQLSMDLHGTVAQTDRGQDLDLELTTRTAAFGPLLSLARPFTGPEAQAMITEGTLAMTGRIQGEMPYEGDSVPGFVFDVDIRDAAVHAPDVPGGVEAIALDLDVRHPGGDLDAMTIQAHRFAATVSETPLTGTFTLARPFSDPRIDLDAVGGLDLDRLAAAMPDLGLTGWTGDLDLDVHLKGSVSAFEAHDTDAVEASGTVKGRGVRYANPSLPSTVTIEELDLALSTERADIKALSLSWKGSDLAATGYLDQLVPYALGTAPLTGRLKLTSATLDARPFQTGTDEATQDDAGAGDGYVVPVPADLELVFDTTVGRVVTEAFELTDLAGTIRVADQAVALQGLTSRFLGSTITLDGAYTAPTADEADLALHVDTSNLPVAKTIAQFTTLGELLPALADVAGSVDLGFDVSTTMLASGDLDLATLSAAGLALTKAVVVRSAPLEQAATLLNDSDLRALDLGGRTIRYAIDNGKARLEPFKATLGKVKTTIQGTADLGAKTVDLGLDLRVPTQGLTNAPFLAALKGALPRLVDVRVAIVGPYNKPKVSVTLPDGANTAVQAVGAVVENLTGVDVEQTVRDLVAEARAQGDALVAEARKQAAALRAEGKKQSDRLIRKGRKEADKLVEKAGANPLARMAAEASAKVALDAAKVAADKALAAAGKEADKVIDQAEAERDKLVAQAAKEMKKVDPGAK